MKTQLSHRVTSGQGLCLSRHRPAGLPCVDCGERVGDIGGTAAGLPENKVTTSLRYAHGPWSIFLQERYIGGGVNDRRLVESATRITGRTTIDDNTVDSVLYTDLTFNYAGGRGGGTPWEAFFTVNNLFDEEPPFDAAIWAEMNATDRPTRATAYPVSNVIIGANAAFAREAPGIISVLDAYETTNALVSQYLAYMRDNNATPEQAAVEFLRANADIWRPWVSEDAAARILAALGR